MATRGFDGVVWAGSARSRDFGVRQVWTWVGEAMRARRTRRELMEMDGRMLSDIGIGRAEAWTEAQRAVWDRAPRSR